MQQMVSDSLALMGIAREGLVDHLPLLSHQLLVPSPILHDPMLSLSKYSVPQILAMGVKVSDPDGEYHADIHQYQQQYKCIATNDLYALLLAEKSGSKTLLAGDPRLHEVARQKGIQAMDLTTFRNLFAI